MNILHFILGKANPNRANGVNQVVYGLAKTQTELGHNVKVIGISHSTDKPHEIINRGNFNVDVFKSFNSLCKELLKKIILESDIVHLHGVWNYYNIRIGRYCEKINKPYIVTAHGGYVKQAMLKSSYIKKLVFHTLYVKHLYEHAAFVQALTYEESSEIQRMCPNALIKVIPNGINFTQFKDIQYKVKSRNFVLIGYLGRISKEKNIHSLLKAITLLPKSLKSKIKLEIIGPVDKKDLYYIKLCKIIKFNKLENTIFFTGAKYSEQKVKSLLELDIYVQPSLIEGLSISILEILALGIPAIITRTSNMAYYYNSNSFIMSEPTATDIARAIEEIISQKDKWENLSNNARQLVKEKLTWTIVTETLCKEYKKHIK